MSGPPTMTPATLTSATATKNAKAAPAPQPQVTVIAIHSASTAAMITPRPDTTLGSVSFAGALRHSNLKHSKRRRQQCRRDSPCGSSTRDSHPRLLGLSRFAGAATRAALGQQQTVTVQERTSRMDQPAGGKACGRVSAQACRRRVRKTRARLRWLGLFGKEREWFAGHDGGECRADRLGGDAGDLGLAVEPTQAVLDLLAVERVEAALTDCGDEQ